MIVCLGLAFRDKGQEFRRLGEAKSRVAAPSHLSDSDRQTGTHRADQRQTGVVRHFITQSRFGIQRQSAQAGIQKHEPKGEGQNNQKVGYGYSTKNR